MILGSARVTRLLPCNADRMVALAYHQHRTMPELVQFASLLASTLGMEPAAEPAS